MVLAGLALTGSCATLSGGGKESAAAAPAKSHEVRSVSQQMLNAAADD